MLHPKSLFWYFSVCFTPKLGFLFIHFQGEPGTINAVAVPSGPHRTGATLAGRNSSCHPGLSIPPALGQGWEAQNLLPAPQTEHSERLLGQKASPRLFLWTWKCLLHHKIKHQQLFSMVRDKIQSLGGSHHLTSALCFSRVYDSLVWYYCPPPQNMWERVWLRCLIYKLLSWETSFPAWEGHGPEDAVLWSAQISCQEIWFDFRGVPCGSSTQCINISITTETPWVSCNNHSFLTSLLLNPKPHQGTKHRSPGPAVLLPLSKQFILQFCAKTLH